MASGDAVDVDQITEAILASWESHDLRTNTLSSPTRGPQYDEDVERAHRAIEVMVGKFRVVADSIRAGAATRQRSLDLAVEVSSEGTAGSDVLDAAERFATWVATGARADVEASEDERATS